MKFISSSCASLGLALLLNGIPLTAQVDAGKPDPTYSVPAALDLPYALAFALDNNFAIRQAKERIRQQDGVVLEVRSTQIPTVAAGGSLQRNDTSVGPTGEDRYWWGRFRSGARATAQLGCLHPYFAGRDQRCPA